MGANNPLSAGTQHQANLQSQTGAWTGENVDPSPSDLGTDAWSHGERAVSGSVAETRANSLGGPAGGDTQSKQDDGDDDEDDYTIEIGMVEVPIGEAITKSLEFVTAKTIDGIVKGIDTFNAYILGLPAPGEPTEVSTWLSPDDPWPIVYSVYGIMATLAIALLTPSAMVATDTIDPHRRRERLIELGKASFFILLGIPVIAFSLHFGNELAQAVAPGGWEFVSSTNGISDLGVGLLLGVLLIAIKGSIVGIGILMSLIIYMSIYILVAFWPIFWALRVQPQADLQSYGIIGIAMFPLVILLRFSQSGILRLVHELPYGGIDGQTAFKLLAVVSGLMIALIGLPYIFLTKMIPESTILAATEMPMPNLPTLSAEDTGSSSGGGSSQDSTVGASSGGPYQKREALPSRTDPDTKGLPSANSGPSSTQATSTKASNEDSTREGSSGEVSSESQVGPKSNSPSD